MSAFLIGRVNMFFPVATTLLMGVFTTTCCLAKTLLPETISEEARAFLNIAVLVDMSQAETCRSKLPVYA